MPSTPPTVAFLGPLGTYSHQATTDFFGSDIALAPCERIIDVFTSVSTSTTPFGLVPIENSSIGTVAETQEALRATDLCVRGMTALKIGHALLARKGWKEQFQERVYSHEQGLGQCLGYLEKRYPGIQIIPVNSTAAAAQEAARDPSGLAICSLKCAEVYDLDVVDTDIQDGGVANTTRFVVLSKAGTPLPPQYPLIGVASLVNGVLENRAP